MIRNALAALALPLRTTPLVAGVTLALTVFAGAAPAGGAWLTMLLADSLTSGTASPGRVAFLAVASALAGGLAIALLYLGGHLGEVVQQRVAVTVESRLFQRIATLPGLRQIEDPAYHDRLRLAEQAAQEAPGTISEFTQEVVRSVVLLASFAGADRRVRQPRRADGRGRRVRALVPVAGERLPGCEGRLMWIRVTVRGNSMSPTFADGQKLLARRLLLRSPRRREVIVFRVPDAQLPHRIKRVAAIAGDPVPSWLTPSVTSTHVPAHHVPTTRPCDGQNRVQLGKTTARQRIVQRAARTPGAPGQLAIRQAAQLCPCGQPDSRVVGPPSLSTASPLHGYPSEFDFATMTVPDSQQACRKAWCRLADSSFAAARA